MNITMDEKGNLVIESDDGARVTFEASNNNHKGTSKKEDVLEEIKRKVSIKLEEAFNEPGMKFTTSIGDSENTSHVTVTGKDISIQAKNVKFN